MQLPSKVPAVLTFALLLAFNAALGALMMVAIPAGNRDIVVYMIGQLSGGLTSALAFWLGTTRQSENKTAALLAQQASPKAP